MQEIDPVRFVKLCWPDLELYDKQREILYSVRDNEETYVPAGNGLGKDFVSALAVLWFFISRRPARVVTTSVQATQLEDVLWGEIRRFLDTSAVNLPIHASHMHLRQVRADGNYVPLAEVRGQVTKQGESLLGRHWKRGPNGRPSTMVVFDEASGIGDATYESSDTWAHCKLIIGNPYPCANFFYRGVKRGTLKREDGTVYSKVIRIKAEDSPNIRLAEAQKRAGREPTNEILIPGVVDWRTYRQRRRLWDAVRQCVGLDADFYEGAEVLLFPPFRLNAAETRAEELRSRRRQALAIGCDPAEGGDSSSWAVVDEFGLIELKSMKTPNTSVIPGITLALMKKHNVDAEAVLFDAGGGGKQHADAMRAQGHNVQAVAFGGTATPPKTVRRLRSVKEERLDKETAYVYRNRRAEMYGILSQKLDTDYSPNGFGIPKEYDELRRQLAPIPLQYDAEGRLELPPKNKTDKNSTKITLQDLIGRSPDDADALALAVFGMSTTKVRSKAGVAF